MDTLKMKHEYVRATGTAALYTDKVCAACGEWPGDCPVIEKELIEAPIEDRS